MHSQCLSHTISLTLRGGFLNYATYATQGLALCALHTLRKIRKPSYAMHVRTLHNAHHATSCCMVRVGLQCTKWRHSKLLFCLFFCEKSVDAENERHTLWTRDIRDERGEFSLFDVQTRPQIISSRLPVLPSLIVLLSEAGPATATIRSAKRRHVIGQTLRCLREIRTWVQLSSCVACGALLA